MHEGKSLGLDLVWHLQALALEGLVFMSDVKPRRRLLHWSEASPFSIFFSLEERSKGDPSNLQPDSVSATRETSKGWCSQSDASHSESDGFATKTQLNLSRYCLAQHNSTYIASVSEFFFCVCVSGAPLPFWYLWSSFWVSALACGCVTGIFHPVCLFSFAENVDEYAETRCNERNLHFMWGFDLVCLQSN